ncbi:MAG TPA: sigma-70 family RNA polymerase sigma factor [Allosphingosinicella sp.]
MTAPVAGPVPEEAWVEEEDSRTEAGCEARGELLWLDRLYRSASPRLLRFLWRRTGSREEARDLVQDVFCRVAGRRLPEGEIDKPDAYLRRVAVNLLKDRAKAWARHRSESHIPADEEVLPAIDPRPLLESRDILGRLEAAMLKLKPKTREIFMAHRLDGLSYAEIAEQTGLSVKGVEKQMSKAIAQIARLMD